MAPAVVVMTAAGAISDDKTGIITHVCGFSVEADSVVGDCGRPREPGNILWW